LIRIPVPSVFKIVVQWRLIELREHAECGKMSVRSSAFEKYYVHSDCTLLDFPVTPCRVMSCLSEEFAAPYSERLNLVQAAVTLASICTKSISLKMEAAC